MSTRPNLHKWNDVQTAIATVAIVTTLGMWNLFATPAKTKTVQTQEPVVPPTEPTEPPVAAEPTAMPQVKIMFTQQLASQSTTVVQQAQNQNQPAQTLTKKKRNKNNGSSAGGGTVTQTKSS
jgi:hypothetical protein